MFEDSYFSKPVHIIFAVLYVLVSVFGIIGGLLIWILVLRKKQLRSLMNYLLLNLSLSDIVASISVYPYLFIIDAGTVSSSPRTQALVCMATEGLSPFFIASGSSLFTLCAMSYNRYVILRYPTKPNLRMSGRGVVAFSIFAWLFGIICMLPGMLSFKYDPRIKCCVRDWKSIHSLSYRLSIMFLGLIFPLMFLLLSYSALVRKSREMARNAVSGLVGRSRTRLRKAERTLGQLALVFIVCWLPFSIYWSFSSSPGYLKKDPVYRIPNNLRWQRITVLFCTLNGALNPVIYILGCNDLKCEAKQIFWAIWMRATCRKITVVSPMTS